MTFERMEEIANQHGCGLVRLPNGNLSLTSEDGSLDGWNEIRPQSRRAVNAFKMSDLRLALGY
jgi:hypothetical protein